MKHSAEVAGKLEFIYDAIGKQLGPRIMPPSKESLEDASIAALKYGLAMFEKLVTIKGNDHQLIFLCNSIKDVMNEIIEVLQQSINEEKSNDEQG